MKSLMSDSFNKAFDVRAWHSLVPFHCWIIFHLMKMPHFTYAVTCWWSLVFSLGLLQIMPPQVLYASLCCGYMFSYILGRYLRVELLACIIILFLSVGETAHFSKVVVPFYNPTNNVWAFLFLQILTDICLLSSYNSSGRCEMVTHWGFNLCFPSDDTEHLFIYWIAICVSWVKCLFISLVICWIG